MKALFYLLGTRIKNQFKLLLHSPGPVSYTHLTTAGGLLLMVRAARRLIDVGFSLEETARKIEAMRDAVNIRFSVGDMTPLRRSGRLGPVRQSVGTILNIRPILTCRKGSVCLLYTSRCV